MFKRIAPLLVALAMAVAFASPASAGYDGGTTTVNGDTVTATRTGCDANTQASAELQKQSDSSVVQTKTGTTNGSGEVTFTFDNVADGTYKVAITCFVNDEPNTQVQGNIVVRDDATTATTAGSGTLPNTGSDSSLPLARLGIVLVAAGGVAIFAGQKRRSMMRIDA